MQENAFEHVVWEMAAILSRPQCVNQQLTAATLGVFLVPCAHTETLQKLIWKKKEKQM